MPGLDTLRSLAIVCVIAFHLIPLEQRLPESYRAVAGFGWIGVDLFFVLSGYLIGTQLLKPYLRGTRPSMLDFYRRRAYRILPAYAVVTGLYFAWPAFREWPGLSPLWEFATFTLNLCIDYARNPAYSHAWSLCVEEHFYLLLPLIVLALMRRPAAAKAFALFAAVLLAGIALRWWFLVHLLQPLSHTEDGSAMAYLERIYYPTYSRLDGLLMGVALAAIRLFRPVWWQALATRGHALLASGLALTAVSLYLFAGRFSSVTGAAAAGTIIGYPLLALAFALLVASAVSSNGWLARWRIPGAETVATLSYSLYLSHKAVVHLDQHYLGRLTGIGLAVAMPLYALTCLGAAWLLHRLVELPFLRLREHRERRSIAEAEALAATEPAL